MSDSPTTDTPDFGVDTFGDFAPEYDLFRPRYPDALWAKLMEEVREPVVADLGCGTGIASVELARRGARVTGVEPDPGMRGEARQSAARVGVPLEVVAGNGEVTSLEDSSRDLVTSAQSFHWFATHTALKEIARILRPEGRFAMWWNERDVVGVPYMDEFECMIKRYNPSYRREYRTRNWSAILPRFLLPKSFAPFFESIEEGLKRYNPFYRTRFSLHDWRPLLNSSGRFRSVERLTFDYEMPSDIEHFCNYAFTLPFVRNEIDESRHDEFRKELKAVLRKHHGENPFQVKFTTWLYLSRK